MRPLKKVIVITPSESLRNEYALQMDVWGYRVFRPSTMDEAMDMVKAEQPDAVLCDRMADGMIQLLAAAAPERTGFVLVTEATRKVQGFNAILRDRIKAAATRKPGPKKGSASVANPAISTGTHGILALLVALVVSQFAVRLNGQIKPYAAATNGKVMLHVVPFGIARQAIAFTQVQDFLSGGVVETPVPNRGSRVCFQKMSRPAVALHEVHQYAMRLNVDHAVSIVRAVVHAHAGTVGQDGLWMQRATETVQPTTTACAERTV